VANDPLSSVASLPLPEQHTAGRRILQLLHARAQIIGHVVAVAPGKVLARRRHHVLGLGLQLDRPLGMAGGTSSSPRATAGQ
jgi:hypothetical protein